MYKLRFTPEAQNDLELIFEYTFKVWAIIQTENYQDEIFSGIQLILKNALFGKLYPYSAFNYRILQVNRHLVFYRLDNNV